MSVASSFPKVYHRTAAQNCKKLVIAVHGMGDQSRNDMVRCVSSLFAQVFADKTGIDTQAIHLPQGLWEGKDTTNPDEDELISYAPADENNKFICSHAAAAKHADKLKELADIAFAEIYWADIPREIEDAHRLEPSPQWAASVVDRLRQRYDLMRSYTGSDVTTGATVVEEVAETLNILSRVLIPLEKAGSFTFDLGRILNQYLGDVQQVADYMHVRERILKRFRARIDHLAQISEAKEIHFVAHSEGTVLTLRTLLRAMNSRAEESPVNPEWLGRVRSLTTLGSPIDKHLFLWPEMWGWLAEGEEEVSSTPLKDREPLLEERRTHWRQVTEKIRWRNYYDYADPVGYDLDTVREKLELWGCQNFEFKKEDDYGFRRYPLAGMAHIEYFNDPQLFRHIYDHAIAPVAAKSKPGDTKWGKLSPAIPFGIVVAIHVAAIVVLHHSMQEGQMSEMVGLLKGTASTATGMVDWLRSWPGMIACGLVLSGTTFWSRAGVIDGWRFGKTFLPMLFYFGTVGMLFLLAGSARSAPSAEILTWSIAVPSLLLVGLGRVIDSWNRSTGRSPLWALRWQMIAGGAAVGLATLLHVKDRDASLLTAVLGSVTFMYVWWLGVLLYDLCYVWKRYINTTGETFIQKMRNNAKLNRSDTRECAVGR